MYSSNDLSQFNKSEFSNSTYDFIYNNHTQIKQPTNIMYKFKKKIVHYYNYIKNDWYTLFLYIIKNALNLFIMIIMGIPIAFRYYVIYNIIKESINNSKWIPVLVLVIDLLITTKIQFYKWFKKSQKITHTKFKHGRHV
jgi:hypothetical protein